MSKDQKGGRKSISKEGFKDLLGIYRFILPYKWLFLLGLLFLTISTFLVLGFPVLSGVLLDVASGDQMSFNSGQLMKSISENSDSITIDKVSQVAWLLMGILAVQSVFSFFRVYIFAQVTEKSMATLRTKVFTKMLNLPVKFFDNQRVGDMISRLTSDISIVQETLSITSAELFRQFMVLLIGITVIFIQVPDLALFMLAIFPAAILIAVIFGKSIKKLSKKSQSHLGDTNVIADESMQSIMVVKAFTNEWFEINRYSKSLKKTMEVALHAAKYRGAFISFIVLALFGAIVAVMWKGASLVDQQIITSGELVSFVLLTMFIGASIAGIGDMYGQVQKAVGAAQRIKEVLDEEEEVIEKPKGNLRLNGDIEFDKVHFTYPETQTEVITDVSFKVGQGQKVALVGPSGAGKSTITQLLLRFYPDFTGTVTVDGVNIAEYPLSEYRNNIAMVPQEVMLFGGTIWDNIKYGKMDATDEEIMAAAKKANLMEFVEKQEQGFETLVGERGVKLSGGQKQRIAIARAILKNPSILILDEATSSLDAASELLVQSALEELMKERTTLIIAHRLSTIRNADKILVLNNGKIEENGTHHELSEHKDGMYSHLLKLQFQVK